MASSGREEPARRDAGPPSRVVIEGVRPEIDAGQFPIKRTAGEEVIVSADIFAEGHDLLSAVVRHRPAAAADWAEVPMVAIGNDRWSGAFRVGTLGRHEYTIEAWVDRFGTWRRDLGKKTEAGQDVASELSEGALLVRGAAGRARGPEAEWLNRRAEALAGGGDQAARVRGALDPELAAAMSHFPDRRGGRTYERTLGVVVERERARYGAWYEMFPRSASPEPGRPGTLRDTEALLDYVASMGFDVLYLPPDSSDR